MPKPPAPSTRTISYSAIRCPGGNPAAGASASMLRGLYRPARLRIGWRFRRCHRRHRLACRHDVPALLDQVEDRPSAGCSGNWSRPRRSQGPAGRSGPERSVPVAAPRTTLRGALIRQPGARPTAVRSRHAVSEPHHSRHPTCPNPGWRVLPDTYCRADRHSRAARCAAAICPALMRFSSVSRVLPEMESCASARLIHM